jgi:hypothetical protein
MSLLSVVKTFLREHVSFLFGTSRLSTVSMKVNSSSSRSKLRTKMDGGSLQNPTLKVLDLSTKYLKLLAFPT